MATFQLLFNSREQMTVRRGQVRRIGWVIKTFEAQVGQFLLGCKCPVIRCNVWQEEDPIGYLPAAGVFTSKVLQSHQQRWVILRVDSLALCKIISEKYAVLIPKNRGEKFSERISALGILLGRDGAGWAAMPPFHWLLLCIVSWS
jgi:hypothetical protein